MDKAEGLQLHGLKVLVTRPEEQAAPLLHAISAHGGEPKPFPLLEIKPSDSMPAAFERLDQFQLVIFVSRNAVKHAWAYLGSGFPTHIKVAAIGQGTADELMNNAQHVDYLPADSYDSEGLLALDALQSIQDLQILIVRGQSGREHLAKVLQQRGAKVEYAEVYQRLKTERVLTNADSDVDAIVVSSSEAFQHLATCAERDQQDWVFDKPIVVIHPRIAVHASELGFTLKPLVVEQVHEAGLDSAILNTLKSIK